MLPKSKPLATPVDYDPFEMSGDLDCLHPPTASQRQVMALMQQQHPSNCHYTFEVRLNQPLSADDLHNRISQMLQQNPALRAQFSPDFTAVIIAKTSHIALKTINAEKLPLARAEDGVKQIYDRERATPFDTVKGPLARFHLIQLPDQQSVVVFSIHRLICDSFALRRLIEQLFSDHEHLEQPAFTNSFESIINTLSRPSLLKQAFPSQQWPKVTANSPENDAVNSAIKSSWNAQWSQTLPALDGNAIKANVISSFGICLAHQLKKSFVVIVVYQQQPNMATALGNFHQGVPIFLSFKAESTAADSHQQVDKQLADLAKYSQRGFIDFIQQFSK